MTSLEKGNYFTVHIYYLKTKKNKNLNISVRAPLSAAHTDIFDFFHKSIFDHNTCTVNWVPLTGNVDSL